MDRIVNAQLRKRSLRRNFARVILVAAISTTGASFATAQSSESIDQPRIAFRPTANNLVPDSPVATPDDLYGQLKSHVAEIDATLETPLDLPPNVDPGWWQPLVFRSLREQEEGRPISLDETLFTALHSSQQIQVYQRLPGIRRTAIVEADAAFDWTGFIDTLWNDVSDPIGNTLTAGPGISRFRDHHWTGEAGVRRRTHTGGELKLSNQFGWQDNNSQYFLPDQQGTSRIVLGFTQPLMRGAGTQYNDSLILLAKIDHQLSCDEVNRQIQTHLLEVSRAYWSLYLERGALYQQLRSFQRAKEVVDQLKPRLAVDVSEIQMKSAEAALADRRSGLQRSYMAVRNAESKLRALVNSPTLGQEQSHELIPLDVPTFEIVSVDTQSSNAEALYYRPEINQAMTQIKAACVRLGMARNEVLPMLNLVTQAYVAGLAGEGDIGRAWGRQFTEGEPGYSIGLQYEVPVGNRAAKARVQRRHLEMARLQSEYQLMVETVTLEVEVAVREVQTSQQELITKQAVVNARNAQLDSLTKRWQHLPNDGVTASLMLENILEAQDQLARAEYDYLHSQMTYNLSLINLRKATGTLMRNDMIATHTPAAP